MDNKELALSLAAQGLYVLPCNDNKLPLPVNGASDATTDVATIEKWWGQNPGALVAVNAGKSGLTLLDIDIKPDKGVNGHDELSAAGYTPTDTFHYTTKSGGEHRWYAGGADLPQALDYMDAKGTILAGIDRKSGNTYGIWWSDEVPEFSAFTPVPEWFTFNRATADRAEFEGTAQEWMDTTGAGEPDKYVLEIIKDFVAPISGHSTLISAQLRLVKLATEGRPGIAKALVALHDAWLATSHASGDPQDEWDKGLAGAIRNYGSKTETTTEGDAESSTNPIKVLSLADLRKRPQPKWWVDGLFQQSTVAMLAGRGGIGKSFIMLDICARIASGVPDFHGQKVKQGKVMYVAAEGADTFINRVAAWEDHYGYTLTESNFGLIESGVNLSNEQSVDNLIERIKENDSDFIVLDTFSQLTSIDSENDASQTSSVMKAALRIRQARPLSTVVLVHHANKASNKYRGSSAMRDNVDTLITATYISKTATSGAFMLTTDTEYDGKQRNGKPIEMKGFVLSDNKKFDTAVVTKGSAHSFEYDTMMVVLNDGNEHAMSEFVTEWNAADNGEQVEDGALRARFQRVLDPLLESGKVIKVGTGKGTKYKFIF